MDILLKQGTYGVIDYTKKLPPKIPYIILYWERDSVLPDCFALAVNHMILGNKT